MKRLFILFSMFMLCTLAQGAKKRDRITLALSDLKEGDVFSFTDLKATYESTLLDGIPGPIPLMRGVSTYGEENILPEISVKYQVTKKMRGFFFKGIKGAEKNKRRERVLLVKQIMPELEPGQAHYWHINIDTRSIEQFEDGAKLFQIVGIQQHTLEVLVKIADT